ncbi:TraR/DksA C4-type zinc finger protein [Desulfothermobacter acidiphilus]|uniref:TraR/DksA C4-type zinc finger protein n=1 Tax=Desulfothermobacter acidiphilus TaxID=1938353 RepID=UPI003F8A5A9B
MLDEVTRESLYRRLLREQAELEAELQGERQSLREATGELSLADNHPADLGSELFERSKDLALREAMLLQLQAVRNALQRLEMGTYGYCERCGASIPPERLLALPHTTLCRLCQTRREKESQRRLRPVEEEVLGIPMQREGEEQGYSPEEVWEDVAQHSLSSELEEGEEVKGRVVKREEGVWYEDPRPHQDSEADT